MALTQAVRPEAFELALAEVSFAIGIPAAVALRRILPPAGDWSESRLEGVIALVAMYAALSPEDRERVCVEDAMDALRSVLHPELICRALDSLHEAWISICDERRETPDLSMSTMLKATYLAFLLLPPSSDPSPDQPPDPPDGLDAWSDFCWDCHRCTDGLRIYR